MMRDLFFYSRVAFIAIVVLVYGAIQMGLFDPSDGTPSAARLILMDVAK